MNSESGPSRPGPVCTLAARAFPSFFDSESELNLNGSKQTNLRAHLNRASSTSLRARGGRRLKSNLNVHCRIRYGSVDNLTEATTLLYMLGGRLFRRGPAARRRLRVLKHRGAPRLGPRDHRPACQCNNLNPASHWHRATTGRAALAPWRPPADGPAACFLFPSTTFTLPVGSNLKIKSCPDFTVSRSVTFFNFKLFILKSQRSAGRCLDLGCPAIPLPHNRVRGWALRVANSVGSICSAVAADKSCVLNKCCVRLCPQCSWVRGVVGCQCWIGVLYIPLLVSRPAWAGLSVSGVREGLRSGFFPSAGSSLRSTLTGLATALACTLG
jgi:hypothetical protein